VAGNNEKSTTLEELQMKTYIKAGAGVLLAMACATAHADDDFSGKDHLLGDWAGVRSQLHRQGVDFALEYGGQFAYNPAGGTSHRGDYADQSVVGAEFNLDKLFGWHDATFKAIITDRNGTNLSGKANLGTLQQVQEVYGRGSVPRWTQLLPVPVHVPEPELLRRHPGQYRVDLVQLAG